VQTIEQTALPSGGAAGLAQVPAIDEILLDRVSGGVARPPTWADYVRGQRSAVAGDYKTIVCAGAGVKGGPQMATEVYGADRTTDFDKINAAKTLRGICTGGSSLPAAAPPSPF
jgi:hypothetical protein